MLKSRKDLQIILIISYLSCKYWPRWLPARVSNKSLTALTALKTIISKPNYPIRLSLKKNIK